MEKRGEQEKLRKNWKIFEILYVEDTEGLIQ